MPVAEREISRLIDDNASSPRAEFSWRAWDYADEALAQAAVQLALPASYHFVTSNQYGYLQNLTSRELGPSAGNANKREFEFTAVYQVRPQEDDIEYSFQVGGQSVTLTHSLGTVSYTGPGRVAPDSKGGINISPKGEIQGIAIERPQFTFSLTKHWPREDVTTAYQLAVASLVGSVNASTFGGLPAGCVKLNGLGGAPKAKRFPIKYDFEYSAPETGVTVGDISGISRSGWQYLDIYRMTIDETESKTVDIPHSVFVHQVYPFGDFSILGLE